MLTDVAILDLFSYAAKSLGLPMLDGFEVDESVHFLSEYEENEGPPVVIYTCATNGVGARRFAQNELSVPRDNFDGSEVSSLLEQLRQVAFHYLHRLVELEGLTIVAPPVSKRRPGG